MNPKTAFAISVQRPPSRYATCRQGATPCISKRHASYADHRWAGARIRHVARGAGMWVWQSPSQQKTGKGDKRSGSNRAGQPPTHLSTSRCRPKRDVVDAEMHLQSTLDGGLLVGRVMHVAEDDRSLGIRPIKTVVVEIGSGDSVTPDSRFARPCCRHIDGPASGRLPASYGRDRAFAMPGGSRCSTLHLDLNMGRQGVTSRRRKSPRKDG